MNILNGVNQNKIKEIITDLKREMNKTDLLSLSIIGSFSNPNHRVEWTNDLDILYIFKDMEFSDENSNKKSKEKLNKECLEEIYRVSDFIVKKHSDDVYDIIPCYKCGPFKQPPNGKIIIELHHIINTVNSFRDDDSTFLYDRTNTFNLIWGKKPSEIINIEKLKASNVINDVYGINNSISMIENRELFFWIWISPYDNAPFLTMKRKSEPLCTMNNNYQCFEFLCYSIIKNVVNTIRMLTDSVYMLDEKNDKKLLANFLPEKDYLFFKEMIGIRKKLRLKEVNIMDINIDKFINQTLIFLQDLKKSIKKEKGFIEKNE